MARFPFGQFVTPRPPSARSPRPLFVLGAYPSAVHVAWQPPSPFRRVTAIAVDDEPTPFWDGADQLAVVERWKSAVGFRDEWGQVRANPQLNGPCGQKFVANVLAPLGFTASEACVTDCLDTYRSSMDGAARIEDTYNPWASRAGLPPADLAPHPTEAAIVRESLQSHRARLLRELGDARPDLIVTLGNAALRVLRELVVTTSELRKLAVESYGTELTVRIAGHVARWLPLAHPAAPIRYAEAHARWVANLRTSRT